MPSVYPPPPLKYTLGPYALRYPANSATVLRKVTYRMYPGELKLAALAEALGLQCRVYNSLLELQIKTYRERQKHLSHADLCKVLTLWRDQCPALAALNAQSLQVTAKRLSLAFASFFRRVRAGEEKPGFPRFKAWSRFSGWGYKTHGDGWRLNQPVDYRQGDGIHCGYRSVFLSGIGDIPLRGRGRFASTPKTAEVLHKHGKWYLSVTFEVAETAVTREAGTGIAAFDAGLETLLVIAKADGSYDYVDNPRWLRQHLAAIRTLGQSISIEEAKAKLRSGLTKGFPVHGKLRRLYAQLRSVHGKVARQRHDFYHKLANLLVANFGILGTEELNIKAMATRPAPEYDPATGAPLPNGAGATTGQRLSIHDAAWGQLLQRIGCKAAEAGTRWWFAPTRTLKPTQRCHRCGKVAKKTLQERQHRCSCGCSCTRDENAARCILRYLIEGCFWRGTAPNPEAEAQASVAGLETPSKLALAA